MKTIKAIDESPQTFDDVSPNTVIPSYRKLIKAAVAMSVTANPEESIESYQVGLKLKGIEPDINFEDAEFRILKKACEKNPAQWISHYHAQVLLKLQEAEAT